ncbi:MAG: Uma2 family endonuclease [Planctomycetales bacterium]
MSTATLPPWDIAERPPVPVHRFTVEEYHRLGELGVLTEADRVELLEGWITPKMVHNPPHDRALELTDDVVRVHLPRGWRLRIQLPIQTSDSEPEPDLAIIRGDLRSQPVEHPTPADVGLVVEVADSSLSIDAGTKKRLYARAGIPCYWIVNLIDRRLEVHTDPTGPADEPAYRDERQLSTGEMVALVLEGQEIARIAVADLLP